MALIHNTATLVPSKGDLVEAWLPNQPWAPSEPIRSGVSYRLDDPAGEVGMEGFLLTDAGGRTVHVPLTYRAQPLPAAEEHLLGTMAHSVLGTRWVYDGCGDPVFVATLASTIMTGGIQAEELLDGGASGARRDPQVRVQGSGKPGAAVVPFDTVAISTDEATTTISGDSAELVVVRRVGTDPRCDHTLKATWDARDESGGVLLAGLRLS